jgi:electron transfer flavoprotein alpha subunit
VILVVAEHRDGVTSRATYEAVAAAQQLSAGDRLAVVVLAGDTQKVAAELAGLDVAEVLTLEHAALAAYTADGFTMALAPLVTRTGPTHVVLPHTYQTRDFAPKLAARLRAPILTDVTGMTGTGADATFTRPMFQGKLAGQVRPVGAGPVFVTVQIGAFRADAVRRGGPAPITSSPVEIDVSGIRQRPEPPFQEARQAVDLGQAERIVAVGRGIKTKENLSLAERLATAMRAEVAASRPICDNGWLPMDRQVGSSGQTVAPKLYVALGISGAIQHLVGMKGSRTVVAVNKDADAPIFEVADYGIVGDLFEIVPALTAELEKGS